MGGIILSMLFLQAWVDKEVQKQLESTETDINSISITGITRTPMAANLTINTSASNPYDIVVTLDETQFKILYKGTQFGVIYLPELIIEKNATSIIINTTLELSEVSLITYGIFFYDFISDDNVTFRVTGPLTMHAPALFMVVTSTVTYDKNITVTSEGILSPI
jgi:hypothetical protein